MSRQWLRDGWVQIGGTAFKGLHFRFHVTKGLDSEPNKTEIEAYNLSDASRNLIGAVDVTQHPNAPKSVVVLYAGYTGDTKLVWMGTARTIDHTKDGADWVTRICGGDGEYNYQSCHSAHSWKAGTRLETVLEVLAADLGLSATNAVNQLRREAITPAISTYRQGYAAHGRTVRELDRVTKAAQIDWSIQDGALQLMAAGMVLKEGARVISAATGMIGSPDHGKPQKEGKPSYLRVRCLLDPTIRPGRAIILQSVSVSGNYRCERVVHSGQLDGGDWYSEVDMLPW